MAIVAAMACARAKGVKARGHACSKRSQSSGILVQRERCIRKYFLGRGWSGSLILIAAGFVGKFNLGWVRLVWFS